MKFYSVRAVASGGYKIRFPYDAEAVAAIELIPYYGRRYNPNGRTWWISSFHIDEARDLLAQIGYIESGTRQARGPSDDQSPYARLWCRDGAPIEVVKAAYLALTRMHHPDAGGDTKTMQEINIAFETIERSLQ